MHSMRNIDSDVLPAGGAQAAGSSQQCILFCIQHSAWPLDPATAQLLRQPPGEWPQDTAAQSCCRA